MYTGCEASLVFDRKIVEKLLATDVLMSLFLSIYLCAEQWVQNSQSVGSVLRCQKKKKNEKKIKENQSESLLRYAMRWRWLMFYVLAGFALIQPLLSKLHAVTCHSNAKQKQIAEKRTLGDGQSIQAKMEFNSRIRLQIKKWKAERLRRDESKNEKTQVNTPKILPNPY